MTVGEPREKPCASYHGTDDDDEINCRELWAGIGCIHESYDDTYEDDKSRNINKGVTDHRKTFHSKAASALSLTRRRTFFLYPDVYSTRALLAQKTKPLTFKVFSNLLGRINVSWAIGVRLIR